MLPTRSQGRFWIRPTLALFGVKLGDAGVEPMQPDRVVSNDRGAVPLQIDVLDAPGDLRLGRVAELELVEHVAGDRACCVFGSHRPSIVRGSAR